MTRCFKLSLPDHKIAELIDFDLLLVVRSYEEFSNHIAIDCCVTCSCRSCCSQQHCRTIPRNWTSCNYFSRCCSHPLWNVNKRKRSYRQRRKRGIVSWLLPTRVIISLKFGYIYLFICLFNYLLWTSNGTVLLKSLKTTASVVLVIWCYAVCRGEGCQQRWSWNGFYWQIHNTRGTFCKWQLSVSLISMLFVDTVCTNDIARDA